MWLTVYNWNCSSSTWDLGPQLGAFYNGLVTQLTVTVAHWQLWRSLGAAKGPLETPPWQLRRSGEPLPWFPAVQLAEMSLEL